MSSIGEMALVMRSHQHQNICGCVVLGAIFMSTQAKIRAHNNQTRKYCSSWKLSNEILDFAFLGAGDMMENPKPNNNPNMGGVCAYAGIGVLDFESMLILLLPKNLLNERCV